MQNNEKEYELVPLTPLRKLEKRIEKLEASMGYFDPREFYKDLVDILRINQEIVSELVKSNESLRSEISKLPMKIDSLIEKMDEFLELIKAAAEEEKKIESPDLTKKLEELVNLNKQILKRYSSVEEHLNEIEDRLRKISVMRVARVRIPTKKLIPQKPTI